MKGSFFLFRRSSLSSWKALECVQPAVLALIFSFNTESNDTQIYLARRGFTLERAACGEEKALWLRSLFDRFPKYSSISPLQLPLLLSSSSTFDAIPTDLDNIQPTRRCYIARIAKLPYLGKEMLEARLGLFGFFGGGFGMFWCSTSSTSDSITSSSQFRESGSA